MSLFRIVTLIIIVLVTAWICSHLAIQVYLDDFSAAVLRTAVRSLDMVKKKANGRFLLLFSQFPLGDLSFLCSLSFLFFCSHTSCFMKLLMFHGRLGLGFNVLFLFGGGRQLWGRQWGKHQLEFCALHMHPPTRIPSQLENSANGDWRFFFSDRLIFFGLLLSLFSFFLGFNRMIGTASMSQDGGREALICGLRRKCVLIKG